MIPSTYLQRAVDDEKRRVYSLRSRLEYTKRIHIQNASQLSTTLQPFVAQEEALLERSKAELAQLTAQIDVLRHDIECAEKIKQDELAVDRQIDELRSQVQKLDRDPLTLRRKRTEKRQVTQAFLNDLGIASELDTPSAPSRRSSNQSNAPTSAMKQKKSSALARVKLGVRLMGAVVQREPQGATQTDLPATGNVRSSNGFEGSKGVVPAEPLRTSLSDHQGPPPTCAELNDLRRTLGPFPSDFLWRLNRSRQRRTAAAALGNGISE